MGDKKGKIKEIEYKISDEDKNTIFEETDKKMWKYANYFLIFLVFFSVLIAYVSTIWDIRVNYFSLLFGIDFFISGVFLIEYLYRWKNSNNKIKFPLHFLNILDLVSFLPFFILIIVVWPGIYSLFAIFRIFRIFRVIELLEKMPVTKGFLIWVNKHKIEVVIWFFIIILVLICFSSLLYLIEFNWGNASDFNNLPKSTWWGIYALTTSGDAGLTPYTTIWRVLAGILMAVWPMLISIISSIIVVIFLDSTSIISLRKETVKCKECKTKNDAGAKYCMECGEKIKD